MLNHPVNRTLSVTLDGEPLSFSGRMRLRGKDDLSLFPALFTLDLWNLPEEMALRLSRCRNIAVSHMDACLVSGRVWDVYRRGTPEGILTSVSVSLGLELWESAVSLSVPAGTPVSETVRRILDASGTGIPLLSAFSPDPVSVRGQSFFGRAAECVTEALSAVPCRAMLVPAGLMVVPKQGNGPADRITEADLTDAPIFTGGSLHGVPSLMILSASVSGWRPGQTVEAEWIGGRDQGAGGRFYREICARGIITERSVDADTGDGSWKCGMIAEIV